MRQALYVTIFGLSLLLLPQVTHAGTPSCLHKLVCDDLKLFSYEERKALDTYHQALLGSYDIDYRIIVAQIGGDVGLEAARFFKEADAGSRSKSRKGVMLVLDPEQDIVRLEISAGLDAVYTDAFVSYLQQRQMVPFFQADRVADGILATTEMIVTRAQEAEEGKEFVAPSTLPENLAIGAGAQTKARIGTGYQPPEAADAGQNPIVEEGMSPEQVVAAYHYALEKGMAQPDLDIYSRATVDLRRQWVVTPAQMRNELAAYKKCNIDKTVYMGTRELAVVRYAVDQRKCAPYFLVFEDGAWRLDFVTMMQNIRFNTSNDWRLDMTKVLPYADAFLDWDFNKDGYPYPQRKLRWGINVNTDYRKRITTIHKIFEGTAASAMGLQEGDVIVNWDGIKNPDHKQIVKNMDIVAEGKPMAIQVMRDGTPLTINIKAPPRVQ